MNENSKAKTTEVPRFELSTTIENVVTGGFYFLANLLNTLWLLSAKRGTLAHRIVEEKTNTLTLPFTFLTLMALPGSGPSRPELIRPCLSDSVPMNTCNVSRLR